MMYLRLSAQLGGVPLQPEFEIASPDWPCELQPSTRAALLDWNDRYMAVVTRGGRGRSEALAGLDQEGRALTDVVVRELNGEAKVKYRGDGGWIP
jgi:hypothetical protein